MLLVLGAVGSTRAEAQTAQPPPEPGTVEKKELTEVQAEKKRVAEEQAFQKEYVAKAEANAKNVAGVLERIAAADKAAEDAVKAAEAAAKAAKK